MSEWVVFKSCFMGHAVSFSELAALDPSTVCQIMLNSHLHPGIHLPVPILATCLYFNPSWV